MKTKIAIVGTGGVGGLIGGLLARFYENSDEVSVYFISRGKALESIRKNGIEIEADCGHFFARPAAATDDSTQIGTMDYVLFCTKAYDVKGGITQIMPCIGPDTVIIPFLNGVDSVETIRGMLPDNQVWYGCVYVVAYILTPGHIKESTNGYRYYFGHPDADKEKVRILAEIFSRADICARASENIEIRVWDKFAFISTVATVTSYTDKTYGEILSEPEYRSMLMNLLAEFKAVAAAENKPLSEDITHAVVAQMEKIPPQTTTSMQRDFRAGRNTELESLTGYIVRKAKENVLTVPTYEVMYKTLSEKNTSTK